MVDFLTVWIRRQLHEVHDNSYCKIINFLSKWLLSQYLWSYIVRSASQEFYTHILDKYIQGPYSPAYLSSLQTQNL